MANDSAHVTGDVVELLYPYVAPSPTTPTGAGMSQDVVEVIYADARAEARVGADTVELLVSTPPAPIRMSQDIVEVIFTTPVGF